MEEFRRVQRLDRMEIARIRVTDIKSAECEMRKGRFGIFQVLVFSCTRVCPEKIGYFHLTKFPISTPP